MRKNKYGNVLFMIGNYLHKELRNKSDKLTKFESLIQFNNIDHVHCGSHYVIITANKYKKYFVYVNNDYGQCCIDKKNDTKKFNQLHFKNKNIKIKKIYIFDNK